MTELAGLERELAEAELDLASMQEAIASAMKTSRAQNFETSVLLAIGGRIWKMMSVPGFRISRRGISSSR